jgi:2-succinyl-5-enolpyruvyl-6-hydroxy-3-cyclohexene-1-carboxylate synthase
LDKGITTIIFAGSRNAPLTIGFVSNPAFTCYSIADERSAAFARNRTANETSSSLSLYLRFSVIELLPRFGAFYSQIPMIVISADRPQSKIDIGDGQTTVRKMYSENHSLYNANLDEGFY